MSFGLLVARQYMGFMPFLGIISLAGIIINNAIVLIDRIEIERNQNGLDPARAVIEAACEVTRAQNCIAMKKPPASR